MKIINTKLLFFYHDYGLLYMKQRQNLWILILMLGSVTIATSSYFFLLCCCLLKYFIYSTKHAYISSGKIQKKNICRWKTSGKLRSNRIQEKGISLSFLEYSRKDTKFMFDILPKKKKQSRNIFLHLYCHSYRKGWSPLFYFIANSFPVKDKILYFMKQVNIYVLNGNI